MAVKLGVVCIQETWLKPTLDFALHGYTAIHSISTQHTVVEVWERGEDVVIINYYNPCKRLDLDKILRIHRQNRNKVVWCADSIAYSAVLGSCHQDLNRKAI